MASNPYVILGTESEGLNEKALCFGRCGQSGVRDVYVAELVGFCDVNKHRMKLANQRLGTSIPAFADFEEMLSVTRPDTVIVCTVDGTHHDFVIRALEAGCDVITEKPMTTTAAKVRAILEAEKHSGHTVHVSFNARYGAPTESLYKLLREGVIGDIISADFAEFLNTSHGADYLHKATHHFDQLNWWIGGDPETIYAIGDTCYYGPTREERNERCLTCPYAKTCEFYLDLRANENLKALYLDAESEDGYYRDRCVFSDEIDIEDTLAVAIRYTNGVFNGTKGRIEIDMVNQYHGPNEMGILEVYRLDQPLEIKVEPLFGKPYTVPVKLREGGHGGADEGIREHLFRPDVPDPLHQKAGSRAGAMSVLIGAAGNQSIASGMPIKIADLLKG